jgi:hypothetical protein
MKGTRTALAGRAIRFQYFEHPIYQLYYCDVSKSILKRFCAISAVTGVLGWYVNDRLVLTGKRPSLHRGPDHPF